jgi:two-component system, response regulator FlrC
MKKTILLVEDEEELRDLLATELRDFSYEVIEASNGSDAYAKLKTHTIHLVITDLRMAGGSGLELLSDLRKHKDMNIPAILMSGFADCTAKQAREFGADELLHKPFALGDFVKIVKRLVKVDEII